MIRNLLLLTFLLVPLFSFSQNMKKVEGIYIYRAPNNVSVDQAKKTALERAQLEALASEFGTIVSQQNSTRVSNNSNGESDISFQSYSFSDVRGEWIENIGEPVYSISYEQDMLIVSCQIKGRAREIKSSGVDFRATFLRKGFEDSNESTEFRSGEDIYLSFLSPVEGFLSVYLIDESNNAFCLLPYEKQTEGIFNVKANTKYILFSSKHAEYSNDPDIIDEYTLETEKDIENNLMYVIFSPNRYIKALDNDSEIDPEGLSVPRQLTYSGFQKWLVKCRKFDADMKVERTMITIKK